VYIIPSPIGCQRSLLANHMRNIKAYSGISLCRLYYIIPHGLSTFFAGRSHENYQSIFRNLPPNILCVGELVKGYDQHQEGVLANWLARVYN